jgi:hypothetical protein
VDGVNFLSSIEATQLRAARNGCGAKGEGASPMVRDGQTECTDYCGAKLGAPPAKLCGIIDVQHDTGPFVCLELSCDAPSSPPAPGAE